MKHDKPDPLNVAHEFAGCLGLCATLVAGTVFGLSTDAADEVGSNAEYIVGLGLLLIFGICYFANWADKRWSGDSPGLIDRQKTSSSNGVSQPNPPKDEDNERLRERSPVTAPLPKSETASPELEQRRRPVSMHRATIRSKRGSAARAKRGARHKRRRNNTN